jgi:pimeloyl-ACP methyl ester carboxylesterase
MPYVQLKSAKVHYTDINPAPTEVSKTIVFVHGLGSSQNFYFPLTYSLKGDNRRLILLDSPGSARSPLPAGDAITVQALAGTVLELLEHLNVTKNVTVVGHSMGCLVALHMAQREPEKIEGLVLLGPVYPSAGLAEVFAKRIPAVKEGR